MMGKRSVILVLSYTIALCYYNCCTDGSTNAGKYGYHLVYTILINHQITGYFHNVYDILIIYDKRNIRGNLDCSNLP
jgi:hypothetical protein